MLRNPQTDFQNTGDLAEIKILETIILLPDSLLYEASLVKELDINLENYEQIILKYTKE